MRRRAFGALLAATCLLVASCAGESAPVTVAGNEQKALPTETLQDWVTYGDRLTVVDVTSESASPISEAERERDEGYSAREVTLQILSTHWSRPDSERTSSLTSPTQLAVANGGSRVQGKTRKPVRFKGETYARVGQQYLALLTYSSISLTVDPETRAVDTFAKPSWTVAVLFPLENGQVAPAENPADGDSSARVKLTTLTPEASGDLLHGTDPDPAAAQYADLDPVARYQNVALDTGSSPQPGPAEQE